MKVSIIGAGLSGLASAFYLEKNGISCELYEKKDKIGDYHATAEAMFSILSKPFIDPYQYLGQKYNLFLRPTQTINNLTVVSPNKQAVIKGLQGFSNLRGDNQESLENQLVKHIKSPINLKNNLTYKEILHKSDYVIVATGDSEYTKQIQNWQTDVVVELSVATIEGDIRSDEAKIWLNNEYAPKGYVYLLPWDNNTASLAVGVPKQGQDVNQLFNLFYDRFISSYTVVTKFDVHNYIIGQPEKNQIANTMFIGNAGGFLMPFLGFGQFPAIQSGLLAGKAIVENKNYNRLVKPLRKEYLRSLDIRRKFEAITNNKFDILADILNKKLSQKIYLAKEANILKWISNIL